MTTNLLTQDDGVALAAPGQIQRPGVSTSMASSLLSKLYGLEVMSIKELDSYDDRNFHVRVKADHSNPHISGVCQHGYVLKVINHIESKTKHVEGQCAVLNHLREARIQCPQFMPTCDGQFYSLVCLEDLKESYEANPRILNQIRLLTFVPGELYNTVPYTPGLLIQTGLFLGRIHNVLKGFRHPEVTEGHTLWCLNNVSRVRDFLPAVTHIGRRQLAEDVITAFCGTVLDNTTSLSRGIIHGDFNDMNILVEPSKRNPGQHDICGIIDLADLSESYYVFEVGIAIMYVSVESREVDPLVAGAYFLSGYLQECQLNEDEWRVLKECVCARYAQSLVIGTYYADKDPDNEYIKKTSARGWQQLECVWNTPRNELYKLWCDIIRELGSKSQLPC